jgi:hypothetical protein
MTSHVTSSLKVLVSGRQVDRAEQRKAERHRALALLEQAVLRRNPNRPQIPRVGILPRLIDLVGDVGHLKGELEPVHQTEPADEFGLSQVGIAGAAEPGLEAPPEIRLDIPADVKAGRDLPRGQRIGRRDREQTALSGLRRRRVCPGA